MGLEMKHPPGWATRRAHALEAGRLSKAENSPQTPNLQALLGKAERHEWTPEALGAALSLRHDRADCLMLAIAGLMALDLQDRETVAETVLHDLQHPVAAEREAERQRRAWSRWCSTSLPRRARP